MGTSINARVSHQIIKLTKGTLTFSHCILIKSRNLLNAFILMLKNAQGFTEEIKVSACFIIITHKLN